MWCVSGSLRGVVRVVSTAAHPALFIQRFSFSQVKQTFFCEFLKTLKWSMLKNPPKRLLPHPTHHMPRWLLMLSPELEVNFEINFSNILKLHSIYFWNYPYFFSDKNFFRSQGSFFKSYFCSYWVEKQGWTPPCYLPQTRLQKNAWGWNSGQS